MIRPHLAPTLLLSLLVSPACMHAQTGPNSPAEASAPPASSPSAAQESRAGFQTQTFYLTNISGKVDASEIESALRNVLAPSARMYLVDTQNAIVMEAAPDQLEIAKKLIHELDRPHKTYRLLYTITDVDAGKPVGTQHVSMVVVTGQQTTLKQGSKVPVLTGNFNFGSSATSSPGVQTQYTYLDVGLNFQAKLDEAEHGARLSTKVEQSSIADEKVGTVDQDPIVRQSVIEGTAFLMPGKPLILGSLDIPGTSRHLDIAVMMEEVQ